jgi:nicotinate-nucleotide adenylyltransferase
LRRGILGGTFDPIHNGHLVAGREVAGRLGLDRVVIIPAGAPWQKRDRRIASPGDRLAMVRLAVQGDPLFEVSEIDIRRDGPTYTIDMLEELSVLHPDDEFVLIIGTDLAPRLASWHRYREVLQRVEIAICTRPDYPLDLSSLPDGRFTVVDIPALPISSTGVRAMVDSGLDVSDLVPTAVLEYIREHEVYGSPALPASLEDFRL